MPQARVALLLAGVAAMTTSAAEPGALPLRLVPDQCHDLEYNETDDGWEIRTTGGDPYVFTAPVDGPLDPAAYMLAFEFFSASGTDGFQVYAFPPLAEANSATGRGLARSEGWSSHALDLRELLAGLDYRIEGLRLDFGRRAGSTIRLRNLRLRPPTEAELRLEAARQARIDRDAALDAYLRRYLAADYPCRVAEVAVDGEQVTIRGRATGDDLRLAEAPVYADLDRDDFASVTPLNADGEFELVVPRFVDGRDRLLSRWAVVRREGDGYTLLSPARYAERVTPRWDLPEQVLRGRKGLGGFGLGRPLQDLDELGIASVTVNLVLNGLVSTTPGERWSPFEYAGQTWYANDGMLADFDATFSELARRDILVKVIILIGHGAGAPEGSYSRLIAHPDADPAGIFVMPDVASREGLEAYAAGLDFLARRYSDPEAGHGRIHHWILHNEVNAGWVWTNAGEKSDLLYLDLYQRSLRTCWLIARQYDPNAKVFLSLEHHWTQHQDPRSHPARTLLEWLLRMVAVEGDFDWALAYHPYPQNLFEPRVWEDTQVSFDFDTPKITFRNLEVLDAWVRRPETFYRGRPRAVHLTEQGLNSPDYSETALRDQAAGMAYTWAKVKACPSIAAFDYHNWVDNRHEGGLRLGLRRFPDDPDQPLGRKPIWYVYQALDTDREAAATAFALPVIGLTDWSEAIWRDPID